MAYIGNDVDAIFIPSSVNTSTDLRINGGALTQTGGDVNLDGGTFFLDESANRVGIGTITPGVTLDVVGTIRATNINALDLSVEDKNIVIGDVASPTNTTADGGGVTLKGAVDKTIAWLNATAAWTFSEHISIASAKEYRIAGTKVLDATSLGSAVVSSSLTSVGTIASGTWQGTAIADTYLGTISTALKVSNSATTATSANTASAIVARDENNNFEAGTITAALTGAASSNVLKAGDTMTGALVVPLGAFGTPSLTFTGDLNTGIFSPGADQLAVATDGTGRLFVNSTGDLGVNTGGTQGTKLHVIGGNVWNSNFYEVARFQKSSGTAVSLGFDNTAYVATIGAYSHDGTASNLSFWTYPGSGNVQERLRITSTGTVNILGAGTAGSTQAVSFSGTAPVNSLVLDSSGRVGLGISSPSALLHCFSPDSINTTAYFRLTNSSVGSGLYRNLHIDGTHPNGASSWKGIDITPVQAITAPMTGIDMSWNQIYSEGRGVNINFSKNTHTGGGAGIGVFSRVIATGTDDLSYEAIGGWFVTDKGAGALDPYTSYTLKVENRSTVNNTNLTAFYTDSSTIRGSIYYDRTNNALALSGSNAFRIDTNGSSRLFVNSSGNVGIGTTSPGQTLHVVGSTELSKLNLSGISSSISSTAVDVFVYDTRKDSDGGAWRKRTQHTSWYNETLNTATRGARKEFPAVAVIVSTLTTVTIYDGDDPDMPMWMVFLGSEGGMSSQRMVQYINQQGYYLHALNGILVIGQKTNNDNYGSPIIRFISEYVNRMDPNTGSEGGVWNGTIADRNNTSGYRVSSTETYAIVNSIINDVAMTVLPNAPIDAATGLPVPTIAVATNGGVSVIKDDGSVVNITCNNGSYTTSRKVTFLDDNALGLSLENSNAASEDSFYIFNIIPAVSTIITVDTKTGSPISANALYSVQYAPQVGAVGVDLHILGSNSLNRTITRANRLNFANTYGLSTIAENRSSPNNGMVAYATTSYSSGWMHGDIKGAWLSDTSTASVTGTELITNGTFSGSNLSSYFSVNNCSLAVVSNQLVMTSNTGNYYCEFYMGISDTTKPHYLSFQFVGASNLPQFGIYASPATGYVTDVNAGWSNSSYTTNRTVGTYTILIPAGNSQVGLVFPSPAVYTWTFDNISLKPVQELDRSVNNRGLAVYGTITKTAVATGANLVGYSGFSTTIYLQQPYNSALDFGTGDFSVMFWHYHTAGQPDINILRNTGGADGWGLYVGNTAQEVYISNGNFSSYGVFAGSSPGMSLTSTWQQWVFVRKYNFGWIVYRNGVQVGTMSVLATSNFTETVPLQIRGSGATSDSIALLRISQSVPSPSQILKIYNDEKMLFQENSQATLYGASDAVTALAYDDTTRLLSVGTSSGRSDFSGLKRINNTTTAVTTAISASNGLIAEQ